MDKLSYTVTDDFDEKGILFLLKSALHLTATLIKKVKFGGVFINGENVHMRAVVRCGDLVEVFLPEEESENIRPIPMPLDIIYEDEYIIAVNKPRNMPTHPSRGNSLPTLAEGVCAYFSPKKFVFRAVSRLDRDTSGIVVIAKDQITSAILCDTMKRGGFTKKYDAIIEGAPEKTEGLIDAPIARDVPEGIKRVVRSDGKKAITKYRVLKVFEDGNSLCELTLLTGRTHQIRVHMAYIGHPLLGDFLYGNRDEGAGYMLHAKSVSFPHPYTGQPINLVSDADFNKDT